MRIAVKYCGGCNPAYERAEIVARLSRIIRQHHLQWELAPLRQEEYDVLLVINGCAVGCVAKKFAVPGKPVLIVSGESLQYRKVQERELPMAIYRQLLELDTARSVTEGNGNTRADLG